MSSALRNVIDAAAQIPADATQSSRVQEALREALRNLSHGNIVITVHDGSVEQIDVIKKIRPFRSPATGRRR